MCVDWTIVFTWIIWKLDVRLGSADIESNTNEIGGPCEQCNAYILVYCCTVSYLLLYVHLHIAVQSVTLCCTVSHKIVYGHTNTAVQSDTYCCRVRYSLLYSQSQNALGQKHIAVQSDTYCFTVTYTLLYSQ